MPTIRELIAERMGPAMFIEERRKEELAMLERCLLEVCEIKKYEPETVIGLVRKEMDAYPNRYFTQALMQVAKDKWVFRLDKQMAFEPLDKPQEKEKPTVILRKADKPTVQEKKKILPLIVKKKAEEPPKPEYKPILKKKKSTENLQPTLEELLGG